MMVRGQSPTRRDTRGRGVTPDPTDHGGTGRPARAHARDRDREAYGPSTGRGHREGHRGSGSSSPVVDRGSLTPERPAWDLTRGLRPSLTAWLRYRTVVELLDERYPLVTIEALHERFVGDRPWESTVDALPSYAPLRSKALRSIRKTCVDHPNGVSNWWSIVCSHAPCLPFTRGHSRVSLCFSHVSHTCWATSGGGSGGG